MSQYQGNIIIKNPATPTGPAENGSAPGMWTLNEALRFTRQGIWPTQGVQGRDTYFNYVSMLLSTTSLGNANNNLFVDSSGAFNPLSRNGNPTQGSFTPYSPNWSYYFNGSSTITFPQQTLDADFTIEAWVYYNENSTQPTLIGRNGGSPLANDQALRRILVSGNGRHYFYDYATGFSLTGSINILPFTWTHLAVTRSGTTTRIFTNGVLDASGTWSGSFDYFCVGGVDTSNDRLNGYASNVRVVDGTAVYTANFTPPTTPLTAIAGTELLICQSNRFRDAGPNNLALTINGSPAVSKFSPYSPGSPGITYNQSDITNWSGYFDGSGDYISTSASSAIALGTADFTFECWVFPTSFPNDSFLVGTDASSTGNTISLQIRNSQVASHLFISGSHSDVQFTDLAPQLNQWSHLAISRVSGVLYGFLNGVRSAITQSLTTNFGTSAAVDVGRYNRYVGYISNARVTKNVAVYSTSTYTVPTTALTATANTAVLTCQNAAFTDNSSNNLPITVFGNATVTGYSPFAPTGYWSLGGNVSQGATIPQTTATDLGSGSFTIECWINRQSTGGIVTKRRTDSALTGSWAFSTGASGYFTFLGVGWGSTYTSTGYIPIGKWTHLAVSRSGTNLSMFVDGVRVYNTTDSYDYTCSTYTIIKLWGNAGGNYPSGSALTDGFNGSISNLRIVQGTAVYNPASTSFTVPTAPLTAISGTSLLTCQNSTMKDNSTNNNTSIALYGGGSIQSYDPFYTSTTASNGGSMYFDGSGDYLSVVSNATLPAGDALYTIEAWIYPTALNANNGVVGWGTWGTNNAVNAVKITSTTLNNYWWNNDLNASFAFKINSWYHIVCQFDGTTRSAYVNGTRIATDTPTGHNVPFPVTNCTVGTTNNASENFTGYISGLKVTSGAALYSGASYTVPTTPATPAASTSLLVNGMNAGIYDATAINDMETVGNTQVTTAVSKFGGSSVYFDGTGDYLTSNAASDLYAFGTGDFTIEMWFNLSSFANLQVLYDSRPTSTDGLYVCIFVPAGGSSVNLQVSAATQITGTATLSTGVWYHLALSRSSGSTKMFLNGTQIGSTYADTNAYLNSGTTRPFIGGSSYSAGTLTVNGYIEEVRVTKGVGRYTSNFTPPTQAFPLF